MTSIPTKPASFLLYGDTGTGKTLQSALFAKWVCQQTGGKFVNGKLEGGLRARYYCSDNGGWRTIQPFVDAGIVEVVDCRRLPHPFLWFARITNGQVPVITGTNQDGVPQGKWVDAPSEHIGTYIYDSLTGSSDLMLDDLATKAASSGVNIGGEGAFKFTDGAGAWGSETVGGNNMAHYMAVQARTVKYIQSLNVLAERKNAYVIATATARREQNESLQKIMGPQVAGKALTPELPRMFTYTMHLVNIPNTTGEPVHRLYVCSHQDTSAGNSMGLANRRVPLASIKKEVIAKLPAYVEPADMVQAYTTIVDAEKDVLKTIMNDMK